MLRYFTLVFLLLCFPKVSAQVFNAPEPAPNQNIPGSTTAWSAICASSAFNDYWVNFTWGPPLVASNNEFVLELSDASGNFDLPVELDRLQNKNTNFDLYFQFSLPQNIAGEGYKMRVRGTNPVKISPESDAFPMYYLDETNALNIRQIGQSDFGDGTVKACNGLPVTLEVYNLDQANTRRYNWYRNGQLMPEKGATITVIQTGNYAAELDYGSCAGSGNTLSNQLQVFAGTPLSIKINPPIKSALCPEDAITLETDVADQNLIYTWFKNGAPISSPTAGAFTYLVSASNTDFIGLYHVEVYGETSCETSSLPVEITDATDFNVTLENSETVLLLPSKSITLEVSTDASNADIQWYKNDSALAGEQANTLVLSGEQEGVYFARVILSNAICTGIYKDSPPTVVFSPREIVVSIEHDFSYDPCVSNVTTLGVSQIAAIDAEGLTYDITEALGTEISWAWYSAQGVEILSNAAELALSGPGQNGIYRLTGTIAAYSFESNALEVLLTSEEEINIEASASALCDDGTPITLSTAANLVGAETTWFKDGVVYDQNVTQIQVTEAGMYELWVYRGGCPSYSPPLTIESIGPDALTISPGTTIEITEGTQEVITAAGGSSYVWMDADQNVLSTGPNFTVSTAGTYQILANVGGCQVSQNITISYLENLRVPNVVSVNGDGINDLWVLPNTYAGQPNIELILYNAKGQEVFRTLNYQNNWPPANLTITKRSEVFYYTLSEANKLLKQGTLTVIR
ncbi:MAG: hypothetical protein RLZZ241_2519 [Bacteroidota bacterium]